MTALPLLDTASRCVSLRCSAGRVVERKSLDPDSRDEHLTSIVTRCPAGARTYTYTPTVVEVAEVNQGVWMLQGELICSQSLLVIATTLHCSVKLVSNLS